MDSLEQMRAIAEQCHHFEAENKSELSSSILNGEGINCTMCVHYNDGHCKIKDEILVNMDQT